MNPDHISKRSAEFFSNTSAHGFSHIVSSKHLCKKILWIFIVLGVFCCSCIHLHSIVSAYLEYNYYTSISNTADTQEPLKVNPDNTLKTGIIIENGDLAAYPFSNNVAVNHENDTYIENGLVMGNADCKY